MNVLNILTPDLREKLQNEGIEKLLDFLGDERLEKKKERMRNLLKIANHDEALYREISHPEEPELKLVCYIGIVNQEII